MGFKDLGIVLTVAGMVACGSDGPELPIPAAIERDTTTDLQQAFAGARLARPLAVIVTDEIATVVARAEVRWTVLGGLGATVSDSVTTTDGVGRAQVDVTLGGQDGVFTIRAALAADPEKSVLFDVGALPAPRLTEVSPTTFSGGDTIIVRGVLLKDTLPVEIGGARAQLRYVSATGQAMSVVVPECLVPGPVEIRMLFPGGSTDPVMGTVDEPASQLRLSVGEYVSLDPAVVEGCATFPAAGPNGAQYVVIPQATTVVPNMTTQYRLLGDSAVTVVEATAPRAMDVPAALRFHDFLRRQ